MHSEDSRAPDDLATSDIGWKAGPDVRREQSGGEELANAASHGVGFAVSLAAAPILIAHAAAEGNSVQTLGASVFAASIVLLYMASTLYHALPRSRAKRVFRVVEHSGIYILIAGTYTPFTLGVLRGAWGWTLLGLIWSLAVAGIVFKAAGGVRYPAVSTAVYVAMGWLIVIAARPVWLRVPAPGIAWLVLGGLAYTTGVAFYAAKRLPFGHFVWHVFVLAGTTCHFFAVMWYAA
jgi:hemolysin III